MRWLLFPERFHDFVEILITRAVKQSRRLHCWFPWPFIRNVYVFTISNLNSYVLFKVKAMIRWRYGIIVLVSDVEVWCHKKNKRKVWLSRLIKAIYQQFLSLGGIRNFALPLMGEGSILLTRGYGFIGGYTIPLLTRYKIVLLLMIWTWNFTGRKISRSRLAIKTFRDHIVCSTP